jgi:hypothetical protein
MWKPILKYGAAFTIGFISALILIFILIRWGMYKMIASREGFQASGAGGLVESPATCGMMKIIIENADKNLKRAEQANDPVSIKLHKESLDSIKKEMQSLNCP